MIPDAILVGDIIRFDPDDPCGMDAGLPHSHRCDTPSEHARMQGRVKTTIVAGPPVFFALGMRA